jgi:hypothetical protein
MDALKIVLMVENLESLKKIAFNLKKKKHEVVSEWIDVYYKQNKNEIEETWKTRPEEQKQAEHKKPIEILIGDWEKLIEIFIQNKTETTIKEIAEKCFEVDMFCKSEQMLIAKVLKELGWKKQTGRRFGRVMKYWIKYITNEDLI